MAATLHSLQLITGIALIALVLLQPASGDNGSNFGDSKSTRRGFERFIFVLTIIVGVLFAALSIWAIVR